MAGSVSADVQGFIANRWDRSIVPTLCDYIRIPNKSPAFDPCWETAGHMRRAVDLLAAWARQSGVEGLVTEVITLPGRTPLLYAEAPATGGAQGTVLLYGHYDKQPEFDGWRTGLSPWEPVLDNGRLYGRGGADDGYALFGSLTAIAALEAAGIPHGRCVLLIEGCEESGSYDLPHYVDHLAARIGTPELVICLDAECGNYEQLWITNSLRGLLPGVLDVRVLREGQHSGAAGGIVPSSFRLLRQVLERIERADDGTLHPALSVPVPDAVVAELHAVANTLGRSVIDRFPWAGDTQPQSDDIVKLLLDNAWGPSLATVGFGGAPEIGQAGNTLRPGTQAKLVIRLPPTLDAEAVAPVIKEVLERDPPQGADITFHVETPQTGWHAPPRERWLERALERASQPWFRRPPMYMGMGGTIPFMKMLGDRYPRVQFMVTGVLGPASNAHGPNEFLELATAERLTGCVADVLAAHARRDRDNVSADTTASGE